MLDSPGVRKIYETAVDFVAAYTDWKVGPQHQGHGMAAAKTLSRLALLEYAVDDHVSRETDELREKLDGKDEEPPF